MKVNFKSVKIEGFLSVGNAEIDLNNRNVILVEGKNLSGSSLASNGSGKSCIFEAIYWVLTGKTIRGTREVINRYHKGFAFVKLLMEVNNDEFVLSRYREHPEHGNNLIIHKNGEDISGTGVKKSEQILNNELPFLTEDLIGSVIILGQGLPAKFTNYDPAGRKEILEVLSGNLGIIDGIKEILTNYKNSLSSNISDKNIEVGKLESVIDLRKKDVEEMKKTQVQSKESVDDLKLKLTDLQGKYEVALKELEGEEGRLQKVKEASQKASLMLNRAESKLKDEVKNMKEFKNNLLSLNSDKCPTCGQSISDDSFIEKTRKKLEDDLKHGNNRKLELEEDIGAVKINIDLFDNKCSKLTTLIHEKNSLTTSLKYDIIDVEGKLKNSVDYTQKIQEYEKEITEADAQLYTMSAELNEIVREEEIISYVLREVSRSFRGFLLGNVINYLNTVLKEISMALYGKDALKLVLEDNKVEISYESRDYSSLSGGEQRRADLAMQFALRGLLVNTTGFSSNVLVVDEILDGLDGAGIDSLIRFITTGGLADIESLFIITHNSALPIPYDDKITVTKNRDMISEVK